MTKWTRHSLSAAIMAQELAVEEADRRLSNRLMALTQRMRNARSPLRGLVVTLGPLVAAWFLLRTRRNFATRAGRVMGGDRLSVALNTVLPLLVPVIGVRATALLTALAAAPAQVALPAVAPLVDLNRYSGTWYEIGRLPNRRERRCADEITTTYLLEGSRLRVIHRCQRADGRRDVVRGNARVVDPISRAKLKLTFAPALLRWLPMVWADYWILDVAPDYGHAIVGTPDRRSLWILARHASMAAADYQGMLRCAAAQGYDTQQVQMTTPRSVL